jgi:type IV pilus assembly protein PilP
MKPKAVALGALVFALLGLGCEEEVQFGTGSTEAAAGQAKKSRGKSKKSKSEDESSPKPPPKIDFEEAEFAESDKSRDPFRAFDKQFKEEREGQVESQRKVVLEQYSIEQLKLIGIITRVHPARAMLVDPGGKGHVIVRGQFIGRPEVVQTAKGVGASYEVNWRVDRIRPGDIVLVREDPTNPDVPSATRVIPLRQDGDVDELLEQIENAGS